MTGPVRIHIESTPAHIPAVRGAVEQLCRVIGFGQADTDGAVAAVDEALANIIAHAYEGQPGRPIDIELSHLRDDDPGLEVVLTDRGRVVAQETIHGRDLADIRPGGLGTHIIECCMDVVQYTHPPEGGTELRMTKHMAAVSPNADQGQTRER